MSEIELILPLSNPVLIFGLILLIILFAPVILNKIKIPPLIGLIIAGAFFGPHGFNILPHDASIELFGKVGLLYIMFLAGLEMDVNDFKKNAGQSFAFGMYTFAVPMILGTAVGFYLLKFSLISSILLASMFASHTLLTYPIISKLGIAKNRAVNVAVGGTLITDTLALLILAVIAGMTKGKIDNEFWIRLSISVVLFAAFVIFTYQPLTRWFFKKHNDSILQFIFVLSLVFIAAYLAEVAGVEGIIGAFLAGIVLNRLVPRTSALMNRLEFVGNALFIPFFLIGVGMLVDVHIFFKGWETIIVATAMVLTALVSKFIAAWFTQKTFRFNVDERRMIFGLSNSQAAATLVAVLVGYNIILTPEQIVGLHLEGFLYPGRLLSESVLNGAILMIFVTCTVSSFVTQRGAQNIALAETVDADEDGSNDEKILIAVNNVETTEELVNLCVTVKSKKNRRNLYALNIINSETQGISDEKSAKKILDKAASIASGTDNYLHELIRYDSDIAGGITGVLKEQKITDLILGLHQSKGISDTFLGTLTEGILAKNNVTTLIYKPTQPLSTIKRHIVVIPDKAEKECGFPFWALRVWNLARNTGAKMIFYGTEQIISYLRDLNKRHTINAEFNLFDDWNDFLVLARDVKLDDNMMIVMSKKGYASYHNNMTYIPSYLNKYFKSNSFVIIYPMQEIEIEQVDLKNPSYNLLRHRLSKLDDIGKSLSKVFKKK